MASSSKKPRMDQLTDVINVRSTDFKEIATNFRDMLVDKTELIYIYCRQKTRILEFITAPPRFGKSVNLTMFRCFFKIEVDPTTGKKKTKCNPKTEAVTDTENYRLFADLKLAIMDHPDIVEEHLGRHPVLYVSFKCERSIETVSDAIELCRTVVHRSFDQHKYLCVSEKLTDEDKEFCKRWCLSDTYKKMDPSAALERLAKLLYEHFERDVVFLVDEYDSLVARALVESGGNNVEDTCEITGVDHRVANLLLRRYGRWMKQIKGKHNITPILVRALIDPSQQTIEQICSTNGVDVKVAQQLVDEYKQNMKESWNVENLSSDHAGDLIEAHENSIEEICKKPLDMIAPLLKTDDENIHLLGSLVTGVTYIAGIGWSGIANNITPCRFTQHHQFNQFYGFQSKEIEDLLKNLEQLPGFEVEKQKRLDIIKAQYNGYEYPGLAGNVGEKIYCPWSVMNYLKRGLPEPFWAGAAYIEPLKNMFKNDEVKDFLIPLLEKENETSILPSVGNLTADDLVKLKKHMKGISTEGTHFLFLNFILELGYLTVDSTQSPTSDDCCVKIPNTEVKVMILKKLKDYYSVKCSQKFKEESKIKSKEILNCINSAADPKVSDEEFKKALQSFRQELQTLFLQYAEDCLGNIVNESGLHCFMAEIITTGKFRYFTEHYVVGTDSNKGRLDVLGYVEQFAFLIELKNFPTSGKSADEALNQILVKEYFNAFKHPRLVPNLKRHILMGISVNEDKKMAISAIRNHKKGKDLRRIDISFDE